MPKTKIDPATAPKEIHDIEALRQTVIKNGVDCVVAGDLEGSNRWRAVLNALNKAQHGWAKAAQPTLDR